MQVDQTAGGRTVVKLYVLAVEAVLVCVKLYDLGLEVVLVCVCRWIRLPAVERWSSCMTLVLRWCWSMCAGGSDCRR